MKMFTKGNYDWSFILSFNSIRAQSSNNNTKNNLPNAANVPGTVLVGFMYLYI